MGRYGADTVAVKLASGITVIMPRMVYTETERHDVSESEGVTVAYGNFWLKTMNYETGETFAIGDSVSVKADVNTKGYGALLRFLRLWEHIGRSEWFADLHRQTVQLLCWLRYIRTRNR